MRAQVIGKILDYLNGDLELPELVSWSEDMMLAISDSDDDVEDEQVLIPILGYIGAGDTPGFPLTWEVLSSFLEQLDTKVRVVVSVA